jgi:arylsulfatase A-like enzyme
MEIYAAMIDLLDQAIGRVLDDLRESGEWQLYRLDEDPGEARDLAGTHPDRVAELVEAWERWASEYGVVEPDRPVGYAKPPRPRSH